MQNEEGNTPLHVAVQGGNQEAIKFLLARGCPLDVTNSEGLTIRNIAVANKDGKSSCQYRSNNLELNQILYVDIQQSVQMIYC